MALCLQRQLLARTQNDSTTMDTSTMLINFPDSPTDPEFSVISPSWMMILNPHIQKDQWKRNQILLKRIGSLAILLATDQRTIF